MDLVKRARIAIEMAEEQRLTHEKWLKYIEVNPKYKGDAGSVEHHIKCIARYDHMIAVIEEFMILHN